MHLTVIIYILPVYVRFILKNLYTIICSNTHITPYKSICNTSLEKTTLCFLADEYTCMWSRTHFASKRSTSASIYSQDSDVLVSKSSQVGTIDNNLTEGIRECLILKSTDYDKPIARTVPSMATTSIANPRCLYVSSALRKYN